MIFYYQGYMKKGCGPVLGERLQYLSIRGGMMDNLTAQRFYWRAQEDKFPRTSQELPAGET